MSPATTSYNPYAFHGIDTTPDDGYDPFAYYGIPVNKSPKPTPIHTLTTTTTSALKPTSSRESFEKKKEKYLE